MTVYHNLRNVFQLRSLHFLFNNLWTTNLVIGNGSFVFLTKLKGIIKCGEYVRLYKCFISGNVEIGRFTSINGPNTSVISSSKGKVVIGAFCSIARGVQIQQFNHNHNNMTTSFFLKHLCNIKHEKLIESRGNIVIEDDVWIGTNSVILNGVNIGRGAVVAAGSVVTKNVPPFSIVGGVPAKVLKMRFSSDMINNYNTLKWWEWDVNQLIRNKHVFCN